MNIAQIENNLQQLLKSFNKDTFIYDLLLAYGLPKASITRLQKGTLNLSKVQGEIAWKKKLFFKAVQNEDLHNLIDSLKADVKAIKHDPRFIVVTDFESLLAIDRKTLGTLDIPLVEISRHFDFFLPWAGMEKAQRQNENPADIKAAERMAKLYDEIKKDNQAKTPEEVHHHNVFLSRLLFCFFAEDTGIFKDKQFTYALSSHTQADGSDLNSYLDNLFEVMNTEPKNRKNLPVYLEAFPYVNGGLFRNKHFAPVFTRRSRQTLIDSGELNWSAINPDIFGSMIQAVVTPEQRGGLGMHYTSVPNIKKVIEPLFLNELYEEFEGAKGNNKKLNKLLARIWNIKIFDPACGSGNFLIIAYKELRRLEIKIFKELNELHLSNIRLANFYGIELDDFAHEVAILSLWLAEHQMNQEFLKEFGHTKPALPLQSGGNIVCGNACRLDWEIVCPKNEGDEIYILGNPPYLGARQQEPFQKKDLSIALSTIFEYSNLDYIAAWFYNAARYINGINSKAAFVSTNSICQGEQVALFWPNIFRESIEIGFAHMSFKWTNSAKSNAAVICIIVGLRNIEKTNKYIYNNGLRLKVTNINAYLLDSASIFITRRNTPISFFSPMKIGNKPVDGGNYIFTKAEKDNFLRLEPSSKEYFYKFIGSEEFLNGQERWCLLVRKIPETILYLMPHTLNCIEKVKLFRMNSKSQPTQNIAKIPKYFHVENFPQTQYLVIPKVSSEKRHYLPIGFISPDIISSDLLNIVANPATYYFSVFSSRIHNVWLRVVAGRLKTDFRYSASICYNTFPFPPISDTQKQELERHVYRILEEREKHSEKTLAQLYDPDKMPEGLREAHRQNDLAVERCYRSKPFASDEERLEYLFKLYEQMIAEEKTRETLFEGGANSKRKSK